MTPGESQRVQAWMLRLADGDREPFADLYAALWPLARRFAEHMVGPQEAEDVAQTALLAVFSRASEFDGDRNAVSWVLGIVAWECRTIRTRTRRRREAMCAPIGDDSMVFGASSAASPEETTLRRDLERAYLEAQGALRAEDQETLRQVCDGTRPQVPAATFRKRVERALARLRTIWSSRYEP